MKKKDSLSISVLVGANLIPLAGVLFFNWDVTFIVLLYWFENLIAGFYSILKIAFVRSKDIGMKLGKVFIIPFFCLHYGGFCAVHGFFLTVFFKISSSNSPFPEGGSDWWGPFIFIQMLFSVIARVWANAPSEMIWALLGLFISHGVSFVENYILGGEYYRATVKQLMHQPYQRIVAMHIAIIAAGVFVMKLNSPMPLLIILILLKIGIDLFLHNNSHKKVRIKKTQEEPVHQYPLDNGGSNEI
jgi:hypothetical protein